MPDPNTEHGLQVQLATALRERDEAREEAAKYRKDAFHNAKQGVDCWEERDALRAEVKRLTEALLDFLARHTDCAGLGECVCDAAWPLCGLHPGDVEGARRAVTAAVATGGSDGT